MSAQYYASAGAKLARHASTLLQHRGQAVEQYVTGEAVADIVFVPYEGPNRNRVFVIEVKFFGAGVVPDATLSAVASHAKLIQDANPLLSGDIFFAFAFNGRLIPRQTVWCRQYNLTVLENVGTPTLLANAIISWALAPPLR